MNIIISNKSSIAQQAKINEYRFQNMSLLKAIDVANIIIQQSPFLFNL